MRIALFLVFALVPAVAVAEVFKCDSGNQITYQSEPCADRNQARIIRDRVTVIDGRLNRREAAKQRMQATAKPAVNRRNDQVGFIAHSGKVKDKEEENPSCQMLRNAHDRAWISDRPPIRERMKKLKCSMFDW